MLNGNMAFGIMREELLVRTSEAQGNTLLERQGIQNFEMGGMASKPGWYLASGGAIAGETELADLLAIGRGYALSLPSKG